MSCHRSSAGAARLESGWNRLIPFRTMRGYCAEVRAPTFCFTYLGLSSDSRRGGDLKVGSVGGPTFALHSVKFDSEVKIKLK